MRQFVAGYSCHVDHGTTAQVQWKWHQWTLKPPQHSLMNGVWYENLKYNLEQCVFCLNTWSQMLNIISKAKSLITATHFSVAKRKLKSLVRYITRSHCIWAKQSGWGLIIIFLLWWRQYKFTCVAEENGWSTKKTNLNRISHVAFTHTYTHTVQWTWLWQWFHFQF